MKFGLDDSVLEVAPDLVQAWSLRWVRPEKRTSDTSVLVKTRRSERAAARPDRHLALLEVGKEVVPLVLGRGPVFFAGSVGSPVDER